MGANSGTKGTKEINNEWPQDTGLGDTDKHEERQINLVAEDDSNVPKKEQVLI